MLDLNDKDITCDLVLRLDIQSTIHLSRAKGKFMSSFSKPSETNILGMVENILGIHIQQETRKSMLQKQKIKIVAYKFQSVISDVVQISSVNLFGNYEKFIDCYGYLNSRVGDDCHFNGVKRIDSNVNISRKKMYLNKEEYKGKVPEFYSSLYYKEWLKFEPNSFFEIKIRTTNSIKQTISDNLNNKCVYFIGNSESVVNVCLV